MLLVACGDWPDLGDETSQGQAAPWPVLRPLDEILEGTGGTLSEADGQRLAARAAGLRARASILRRPVEDDAAFEAMRARLRGL